MVNILFNGHDFKFLQYLIQHCSNRPDCRVMMDHTGGHTIANTKQSAALLKEADVIFCEWALGNAQWYSNNKLQRQKLVIRLHRQELTLKYLDLINWNNVDQIVLICQETMEVFLRRYPFMKNRTSLIYNLIDTRALNLPKQPEASFNLGFIGLAPRSKAPHLALELFERLKKADDRYMLFFKGKNPMAYEWLRTRPEEVAYYSNFFDQVNSSEFRSSIVIDDFGDDMPAWFSKIGIILSTSEFEGSHQAVAEGMASGALPVIRNWAGASKLYPERFVYSSVDQAIELILNQQADPNYQAQVEFVKQFAMVNFDIRVITSLYDTLFDRLLAGSTEPVYSASPEKPAGIQSRPMKVALVCFLKPGNQSGYEIRVLEEATVLARQGLEVFIVVYVSKQNFPGTNDLETYRSKMEATTGARVFIFPTDRFFDLDVNDRLIQEVDTPLIALAAEHQIAIFHGEALYAAFHMARVAKSMGGKVVFDNHGILAEETMMRGGNPNWISKINNTEFELLRTVDLAVLVSDSMRTFLESKHDIKINNFQTLPCCIHSKDFVTNINQRNITRERKGFGNRFVFLYLGSLSIWQWPEAMFALYARLYATVPDIVLYLLIPEYDHDKARHYIHLNALPEESYKLEEVPHAEVSKILEVADAGFLLREPHAVNIVSSPTKFGEYLAAGVPVILTSGIGDYSEMAERLNVGVKVDLHNGDLSGDEMQKLINFTGEVRKERDTWATRCRKAAADHLDWDVYGKKLFEQYTRLTGSENRI